MPSSHSGASASPSHSKSFILSSSQTSVASSSSQLNRVTQSTSQSDPSVTPSSNQSRDTLSSSQSRVTSSSSQPRIMLPSSPTGVTRQSSLSEMTLSSFVISKSFQSSNQFVVTLSSSQSHDSPPPSQFRISLFSSQSHGSLSLSQFHGASSSALPTPQEEVKHTDSLGETTYMYSTLEALQMLSSSFLSDRTISRSNTNSARKAGISTLVWYPTLSNFKTQPWSAFNESLPVNSELMEDTVYASGQPGLTLVSTSSVTSGYSASLISRTILQLHQSVESSHAVYASKGNSFHDNVGLSTKTSASLQSSLSVSGDLPLSEMTLSSLVTSQSSTNKTSNLANQAHEDSLVTDTPFNSVAINSLHQDTIQKTQYTRLHSLAYMHNQTGLAGIVPHATDSTSSSSKPSILNSYHNGASSWESWVYNFHSNSKTSIIDAYFSAYVDDMSTNTLAFSNIPSWNRSIGFIEKTIMISTKFSSLSRTSGNIFIMILYSFGASDMDGSKGILKYLCA